MTLSGGALWSFGPLLYPGALLIGFMSKQFEISRLVGIRPSMSLNSLGLSLFLLVSFSSTLWVNQVGSSTPSFGVACCL